MFELVSHLSEISRRNSSTPPPTLEVTNFLYRKEKPERDPNIARTPRSPIKINP